jgi:4-carboxymuconolactone decarboxylase
MQRIPPVDDESDDLIKQVYGQIRATRGHVSGILKSLGHAPAGLKAFAELGEYVRYQAAIPNRTRELLILAIARGNQYAWSHHHGPALKAGVTQAEMDAINDARVPDSLNASERSAVEYGRAYASGGQVSDEIFADLKKQWSTSQIVDLTLMAGYYLSLGSTAAVFQLELEPNFPPKMKELTS